LIGTLINPLQDWMYLRTASKNKERPGKPIPEGRLYTSIPGSFLFTVGLFMYGWTCRPSIHWIVPAIGICVVGVGIYSIYMGVVNYLTDAYEKYAASALSAASLGRNLFGAFLPLASYSLFQNLGFGWAGSLLGFVGLALSFVPIVLLIKGREIRAKSPFMSEATFGGDDDEEEKSDDTHGGYQKGKVGPSGVAGGPPGAVDG
jgi:MFS family permease